MLIDSHCHLGDTAFDADRAEVVTRAWDAGLERIVVIGESPGATALALELASGEPRFSVTAGVHPHDASDWSDATSVWLRETLAHPAIVALGEIGLDYHYDHSPRETQRQVFAAQLALAAELSLPTVIHAREADDDVASILRDYPSVVAIMHSFSSGLGLWRQAVAMGHYISFSGMVTFKNWTLDEAVRETPLDRLLVETDAPYLAPVPMRGKRNEPAFVRHVAHRIADTRGMAPEALIARTGENTLRVFGLADGAGAAP